jgi:hypothetical protein
MAESHATRWRQLRLTRAVYEWGFLGFSSLSIFCLTYWIVSIATAKADINLAFRHVDVQIANGSIAVRSDRYWTVENLDAHARAWATTQVATSLTTTDRGWTLPGFGWRLIRGPNVDFFAWAAEMSILVPFLTNGVLATWCLRRYRAARQEQTAIPENLISD